MSIESANLPESSSVIEKEIPQSTLELILREAKKWCTEQFDLMKSRTGIKAEYELEITPDIKEGYDIILVGGTTPRILISERLVFVLFLKDTQRGFREKIRKTFDQLRRMTKTLSRPSLPHDIIVMKEGDIEYSAFNGDEKDIVTDIDPRMFVYEISHTITVTDRISGTSITLSGKNLSELNYNATQRLKNMIKSEIHAAELHEYHLTQKMKQHEMNHPIEIDIKITDIETSQIKSDYVYPEQGVIVNRVMKND